MFKRRSNKKTKRPFITRNKKFFAAAAKGALLTAVLSGAVFFGYNVYKELLISPYLEIKSINISGRARVSEEEVLELTGLYTGRNILTVMGFRMEKALLTHPFVEDSDVRMVLPDRVDVIVVERHPAAIVNLDGLYLMDKKGVLFKKYSAGDSIDLPVVTGMDGLKEDTEDAFREELFSLLRAIEDASFLNFGFNLETVSEIHADRGGGFTLVCFSSGVRINVGRGDFKEKFLSLQSLVNARGGSLEGIESIDLDNGRGVVVNFFTNLPKGVNIKQGGASRWQGKTI